MATENSKGAAKDLGNVSAITGRGRTQKAKQVEDRKAAIEAAVTRQIQAIAPATVMGTARGRRPVTGRIVKVPCPLYPAYTDDEGVEHPALVVGFRVDNQQQYLKMAAPGFEQMSVREQAEHFARAIALIAHKFEGWDFLHPQLDIPIPVPDPSDWETYWPLVLDAFGLLDLAAWIMGVGFTTAANYTLGRGGVDPDMVASLQESLAEIRAGGEIAIGGPGYEAALEASLPPNSASA